MYFKHEYLRSRASTCMSLSSSVPGHLSIKSSTIEILVLISWIPASKNFEREKEKNAVFLFHFVKSFIFLSDARKKRIEKKNRVLKDMFLESMLQFNIRDDAMHQEVNFC